MEYLILGGFSR